MVLRYAYVHTCTHNTYVIMWYVSMDVHVHVCSCICVYLCADTCGVQKRALDPIELEFRQL